MYCVLTNVPFVRSSKVTNGIGNHEWPLESHCNPEGRSPEGLQWRFRGHEWLPIPLVTFEDLTNDTFEKETWIYLLTHSLECTQLPSPLYDWDDDYGPIQHYVQEQKRVEKEMKWTLAVSLIIHLLMNIPMIILGKLFNNFVIN